MCVKIAKSSYFGYINKAIGINLNAMVLAFRTSTQIPKVQCNHTSIFT